MTENDYTKLRAAILLGAIGLSFLFVLLKLVKLVIPVMGAALTAFIMLTVKAYIGRKAAKKLEKQEDKILGD